MQSEIEEMIAERVAAADLAVQPKRQVRQGTRLPWSPDLHPSARRAEGGIGENGIIIEVKARTERSSKSSQRTGEQKKARSHDLLKAYVKRPRNAAEKKARVAEILIRL